MPVDLTGDISEAIGNALAERTVVLVGTASADGEPDIAYKGSAMVWDAEHMAFWERAGGQTLQNLTDNPKVCLLYSNPQRGGWRFFGVAELHRQGDMRDQIMARTVQAELDRDPERKGVGVLIRIDRVIQGRSVIMSRDS